VSMCCGALWVQRLSLRHTPLDPRAGGGTARVAGVGRRDKRETARARRAPGARERGRERGRCVL
jgi:hypothetical protein